MHEPRSIYGFPAFAMAMILAVLGAAARPAQAQLILSQNFDNVPGMFSGTNPWVKINHSVTAGAGNWHQGAAPITAQAGSPSACIGNDFTAVSSVTGTISAWLITPSVTLQNGQTLQFYTRTRDRVSYPDRLQVRMSTAPPGASDPDVGVTATDVGTFSTLLVDINPTYSTAPYPVGYPTAWTVFSITLSGIPAPTQGRLAFRYFVENAGLGGNNSDIIAIDTMSLSATAINTCQIPLPACNADVAPPGGNRVVDVSDLLAVIGTWGAAGPPRPSGDVTPPPNGDCVVNVNDLLAILGSWGACPPIGACCLPNGQCSNGQTTANCTTLGGLFQGLNSVCAQVTCPQPNNDSCENAIPVAIGSSASGNLETATTDFSPTCGSVVASKGRWHTVVGNGTNLTASTCASPGSFNGRISVYCGPSCDRLICAAAADNNACPNFKDTVTWCSALGQTYWILVHTQTVNPGQGLYSLAVTSRGACSSAAPCTPVNDLCSAATVVGNGIIPFSTIGATTDGPAPAAGDCNDAVGAADVWFLYTATCSGILTVTNCAELDGDTDFDSVIMIYQAGVCPPPDSARLGCNDDDPTNPCGQDLPFASTATAHVGAGAQYLIRVGGFSDRVVDVGSGQLNIFCTP